MSKKLARGGLTTTESALRWSRHWEKHTMNNKELITKLIWLFQSQKFANWFSDDGRYGRYISGDMKFEEGLSQEECDEIIRNDIANFLKIEDKA